MCKGGRKDKRSEGRSRLPFLIALLLIVCGAVASPAPLLHAQTAPPGDLPSASQNLKDLGFGDLAIQGLLPAQEVFVPGPGDYVLDPEGSYLDLVFNHSPLLLPEFSTMTVTLNDNDLTSIRLSQENAQDTSVRIPLPNDRIQPGINKFSFKFIMQTAQCEDLRNPALFARIHQETAVHWAYASGFPLKPPSTDLALFPYPLLRDGYTRAGKIVFVLSPAASQAELSAAASVAAAMARLSKVAAPRYLAINAGVFRPADGAGNDLVVVGKTGTNAQLSQLIDQAAVQPGAGNVRLRVSPYDPQRVALLITGDSDDTVLRSALTLADTRLRPDFSGDSAVITDLGTPIAPFALQAPDLHVSFSDLGRSDFTVTGLMRSPENIVVNESIVGPAPNLTVNGTARLWLSHSPLLDEKLSNMRMTFNGIGLGSVALNQGNREPTPVDLAIPQRALRPGVNQFAVEFNLHLPAAQQEAGTCTGSASERAWVSVYSNSSVSIIGGLPPATPDVTYFPYPFLQSQGMTGTYLVAGQNDSSIEQGLLTAASLGNRNRARSDAVGMTTAAQLTPEQRANYYLLAVGRSSENPFIGELSDTLPLRFDPATGRVLLDRKTLVAQVKDSGNVGLFEIGTSPFNSRRWCGVLTGATNANMNWIRRALERPRAPATVVIARSEIEAVDQQLLPVAVAAKKAKQARTDLLIPLLTVAVILATLAIAGWWVYSLSRARSKRNDQV